MNSGFREYIAMEGAKEVLYMRLNKALYGCIQSALLWYKGFKTKLKASGFKLNKYDPCVWQTRKSTGINVPFDGMLMIAKYLTVIRKW